MVETANLPLIYRLLDQLRGALSMDDQLLLAAQFIAWAKVAPSLPERLRPDVAVMNERGISDVFFQIRELGLPDGIGEAFNIDSSTLRAVPDDSVFLDLWREVSSLLERGFIDSNFWVELVEVFRNARSLNQFIFPPELLRLMVELAQIEPDDDLYTPFDAIMQLALAGDAAGAVVSAEIFSASPWPYIVKIISGKNITIAAGKNPLVEPAFVLGQKLKKFKKSISAPPFGWKVPIDFSISDLYERFKEKTNSGTVLAIRHILSHTSERMVVLTSNNTLSGAGADRSLREDLVQSGLEVVISLPSALLNNTNIQTNILVINRNICSRDRSILFVDGSASRFHKRDGRGRSTLTGWRDVLQAVQQGTGSGYSFSVAVHEVMANDYQLMVSRYVKSDLDEAIENTLVRYTMAPLQELVEFIRPVLTSSIGEDEEPDDVFLEIGSGDIQDLGVISTPKKRVTVSSPQEVTGILRKGDVMLTIRGNVGRVGIVQDDQISDWIPGQSMIGLRVRYGIDPLALMLYLKSTIGQFGLKKISTGSSVPMIQLKELKKMKVPVPSMQEQKMHIAKFLEMKKIQEDIDEMREQQRCISDSIWGISEVN